MIECDFWLEVQALMLARGFTDFDLANFDLRFNAGNGSWVNRLRMASMPGSALDVVRDGLFALWPEQIHQLHRLGERNRAFAEVVLTVTGKKIFVDASKERMRIKYLARYLDAELKVIHLVRDVRGVVNSTLQRRPGEGMTVGEAARTWVNTHKIILQNRALLPPHQQILVRYEDMCLDLPGTLRRLFEFCGADPTVVIEDFRGQTQHLLGNKMRLGHSSEIKLDEKWRLFLTEKDLKEIDRVAGAFAQRLYQNVPVEV
jgi:hypothetical protein